MFLLLDGVRHDMTCLFVYISDVLNTIRHGLPVFIIASGELLYLSLGLGAQSIQLEPQIEVPVNPHYSIFCVIGPYYNTFFACIVLPMGVIKNDDDDDDNNNNHNHNDNKDDNLNCQCNN